MSHIRSSTFSHGRSLLKQSHEMYDIMNHSTSRIFLSKWNLWSAVWPICRPWATNSDREGVSLSKGTSWVMGIKPKTHSCLCKLFSCHFFIISISSSFSLFVLSFFFPFSPSLIVSVPISLSLSCLSVCTPLRVLWQLPVNGWGQDTQSKYVISTDAHPSKGHQGTCPPGAESGTLVEARMRQSSRKVGLWIVKVIIEIDWESEWEIFYGGVWYYIVQVQPRR